MSSSSNIRRLGTIWAVSALVVAVTGCGTQSNPLAATDQALDPVTSSETQVVAQGVTQGVTPTQAASEINIKITPRALVIASHGAWVTVHSDVPFEDVDTETIELQGIGATRCFPDDRGDLVSKFPQSVIKEIVSPGRQTLTLTGEYKTGDTFEGSDTIWVK